MAKLYAWGANSHGQLALGYANELCATPQLVSFPNPMTIKQISGGGAHIMLLDFNGTVFTCGCNTRGQLGNGTTQRSLTLCEIPKSKFNDQLVDKIAGGWDVSAAICKNGTAYMWGSNSYDQLGMAKSHVSIAATPRELQLPHNEKVRKIFFNLRSTCVLTANGTVYVFGRGRYIEDLRANVLFTIIDHNDIDFHRLIPTTSRLSAGQNHTLYVVHEGRDIHGFGDCKYAQAIKLRMDEKIASLKSGWTHNGALTSSGNLYLWGRNNYGQNALCPAVFGEIITQPNLLNCNDKIVKFYFGAEHGLVITRKRNVYTWGWNEHGNCGNNSTENVYDPHKLQFSGKCLVAGCGSGFCYVVIKDDDDEEDDDDD